MRTRTGENPFNEAHGQAQRCYDWIAPPGTDPASLPSLLEAAAPGLKLYHRGDNQVNGYINTSRLLDGSLYVAVCLYDFECLDPSCELGEGKIEFRRAPELTSLQVTALVAAVGEHAQLTAANADRVLDVLRPVRR